MIASKFKCQFGLFGRERYGLHFVHPSIATEASTLNLQVVAFALARCRFVDHVFVARNQSTGRTRINGHIKLMEIDLQRTGLELVDSQNFKRTIQIRTIGQWKIVGSKVACVWE